MLGKRGSYSNNTANKRPRKWKKTKKISFAGKGYNPKQVALRRAPPNAEKKFHEIGQDSTTLQNAGTGQVPAHSGFASLNLIANGDTMSTRNGNKILIDSINIRGRCIIDPNRDPDVLNLVYTTGIFRVILYLDTQANGGAPTMDEFFDTQLVNQDAFDVYNSLHVTGRFKTLMDKEITVTPQPCFMETTSTPDQIFCPGGEVRFQKTIKNLHIPVMFSDNTANLAAVRTNNIGMWVLEVGGGGSAIPNNTHRKFAYRARIRFYDY